ncbi:MAG: hypothetical protein WBG27_07620 [Candidatus Aquilonibacter sp.]
MPRVTVLKLLRRHWPIVLPAILALAVFHAWVTPGLILGSDWVRRVPGELNAFFPWPPAWNGAQQLGETNEVYLFEFPLFSLMGLLSRLHVSWSVIERVFFFWPYLVLGVAGPYALAIRLTRSPFASALAASICVVNTWVIMATERGAIPSLIAAALIPLFMLMALNFIERPTSRRGLAIGLVLTVLLIYDLRYVYISVIMSLIFAVEQLCRDRSLERLRRAALPLAVAVLTAIVTNLYWILPQFFEPANNGTDYGTLTDYLYNSAFMTPQHALSDFAVFYHWVASNNPFLAADPDWWFFVLPVCVFVSLFFVWRRKWVWSIAVGAFVAVLLDSGPSFPVDKINIWIFLHTPGMSLFRDVTKWMSLLNITYAIVIALGITRLIAWIRLRFPQKLLWVAGAIPVVLVACYALIMSDAFDVMRFRVFATYHMRSDVIGLDQFLQSRPNNDRTLVIPRDIEPMRAVLDHPYVEAMQLENGSPNDGFRHFNVHVGDLYTFFAQPYAPDLLRLMNVRYIVVPYDYDKVVYSPQIAAAGYYDVQDFMKSRPWAHFLKRIGRQYVFEIDHPFEARAFVAPVPFVLNGSAAGLAALSGTPLVNPRLAAILPDQPLPGIAARIPNYVAAAWPVDTLANGKAAAAAIVSRAKRLDSMAQRGEFPYVAAAIDTAGTSSTWFMQDRPLLMDTNFLWPATGTAAYSANTLDVRTLNRSLLQENAFPRSVSQVRLKNRDVNFFLDTQMSIAQAGALTYAAADHSYHGAVEIDSDNPISIHARLSLTGVTTSLGVRTRGITMDFKGRRFACAAHACTVEASFGPGANFAVLNVSATGPPMKGASWGMHDKANAYNESVDLGSRVLPVRWLARGLNIRMTTTPSLRFYWNGSADPDNGTGYLVYSMRSIADGSTTLFLDPAGQFSPTLRGDFSDWVETILRDRFARLLADHQHDASWLFANRLPLEPDGSGVYTLTTIGMTVIGKSDAAERAALEQWLPVALELHESPEEFEIAGFDAAARPIKAAFPEDFRPQSLGYSVMQRQPVPGVREYTFTRAGAHARPVRLSDEIVGPIAPRLDFDFYQDAAVVAKLSAFNHGRHLLFSQVLQIDQNAGFGAGEIRDETSIPWSTDVPHCEPAPCGRVPIPSGVWRRVSMDMSHLTPEWARGYTIAITLIPSNDKTKTIRFAVATRASASALTSGLIPALTLDERSVRYHSIRHVPETEYKALSGSVSLAKGSHHLESYPAFPIRPVSVVFDRGRPRRFEAADIRDGSQRVGTEYSGTIDSHGGLLVFSEAYDPRWRLALVPASFHASGSALLDYLRAKPFLLADSNHYRVDDTLNGWWIPAGKEHVFMIMSLDAVLQMSALIWLFASAAWIGLIMFRSRKRSAW